MLVKTLSYEEVVDRHPKEVEQLIKKLRKGKSKHKNADVKELSWSYDCCVAVNCIKINETLKIPEAKEKFVNEFPPELQQQGNFIHQMVSRTIISNSAKNTSFFSLEEKIEDQVSRTSTSLNASVGKWTQSVLIDNPPEIRENAREKFLRAEKALHEYDQLSPQERERKFQEALNECRKYPGFIEIKVQK